MACCVCTHLDRSVTEQVHKVFATYNQFLLLIDDIDWPNEQTTRCEVMKIFKNTQYIEQSIARMNNSKQLSSFLDNFESCMAARGRTLCDSDMSRLMHAPDNLMTKLLTGGYKCEIVDLALETYLSYYDKDKLKILLSEILFESYTHNVLLEKTLQNPNIKNKSTQNALKYELLVQKWSADKRNIKLNLYNYLSGQTYNLDNITIVIKMLTSGKFCNSIDDELKSKLAERSPENGRLWFDLLTAVDKKEMINLCKNYRNIFREIGDFLIHVSLPFSKETSGPEVVWTNSVKSLCPNLTYFDVINFTKCVVFADDTLKALFLIWTEGLRSASGSETFWDHIFENVSD